MTRTKARVLAAVLAAAAIVAGSIAMAAPASATPEPTMTYSWQVLIGSTWTTISFDGGTTNPYTPAVYTPVPGGVQQSRFIITNTSGAGQDATLSDAWFGSTDYNNGGTQGLQISDCPGYTGTPLALPAGSSVTCTGTYDFIADSTFPDRAVLYGFTAQFTPGGQYQVGNQGAYYRGVSDATTETVDATDGTGTYQTSTDAALQSLPAGFVPNVRFSFSNSGATEDLTGVTYTSTGTGSIATSCPSLATTWSHAGAGSGQCTVAAANPATTTPQTVTITAVGQGTFGNVTTTTSFTYAATPATCAVSATTFNPGNSGSITCSGFEPNITVDATLHSVPVSLGSISTGSGTFTLHFVVPKGVAAGTHTISIGSGSTTLITSDPFTVGVLAATGVDVTGPLGTAGVLLAIGGALVFYRRSRSLRTR